MDKLSRRDFLRAGLTGGLSLAAAHILGACSPGPAASVPAASLDTPSKASSSEAVVEANKRSLYTPGTYRSADNGMGRIVVTMTFSENSITDVRLDLSYETPDIGQAAAGKLREAILSSQGAEISAISGATVTSAAVSRAAERCIRQAKGELPVETVTENEDSDTGWLGIEPDIGEDEITDEFETDILVVGCGTGGMFAIAAAAEEGARVIGIDRFPTGVGIRDDLGAIGSRYQKEWGTEIDKFEYITMATQYAAGHINQSLVRLFCEESGAVIDWYGDRLAERGISLLHEAGDSGDPSRYISFATGHSPRWEDASDGSGIELDGNRVLYDYAVGLGARFDYSTAMIKLTKEGGRVTGIIAKNKDGDYIRYKAFKGVIVCTGGYSMNYRMMQALQPWNLRITSRNGSCPGAFGDGIKACLWAGAKMDETHSMLMFENCALRPEQETGMETAKSGDSGFFWMGSQPWLRVNADGMRFFNESGTCEGILHADEYQKGHCHYSIFDSNWTKYVTQFKMQGYARLYPFENGADPHIDYTVIENGMLAGLIEKGFVSTADSIEELAEKLSLPAVSLKTTVDRYNELAYAGEDTDFGKESFRLTPVDTAPFYGAKTSGCILCTLDGIQIDTNMNAIDIDGNPIPGLYVVGNDSGGYFSNSYPTCAGMAAGRTVTFARLAGKYLAKL